MPKRPISETIVIYFYDFCSFAWCFVRINWRAPSFLTFFGETERALLLLLEDLWNNDFEDDEEEWDVLLEEDDFEEDDDDDFEEPFA